MTDETPPLYPIIYRRPAPHMWRPAGIESLPPGWVNVRIWTYDPILSVDVYAIDKCPGVLYEDNSVTEIVESWADGDGEIVDEYGYLYDEHPVVIACEVADLPAQRQHYVDTDWRPAYLGGGYLGTCPVDMVSELLAEQGFAEAVPRRQFRIIKGQKS
ncbi:hypothetical protein [Mycolicibacter virginiensis]|uniref:hypothetical protein n=1 Tax=Mycolicibacter virginiensis TaxID=1795032 RepID=UPI001F043051|nr:hypothetical protein [Mycolicibacter virginiensis]ULP45944.1 hypothetical protein MJO54_13820 [Mycolicibacter virginiensis]